MWSKVFSKDHQADFFYSDKPLEAMKARDSLQKGNTRAKSSSCATVSKTKQKVAPKIASKKITKASLKKVKSLTTVK